MDYSRPLLSLRLVSIKFAKFNKNTVIWFEQFELQHYHLLSFLTNTNLITRYEWFTYSITSPLLLTEQVKYNETGVFEPPKCEVFTNQVIIVDV